MLRCLLLLASVWLLLGLPAEVVPSLAGTQVQVEEPADDCHCCPDDGEAGDCCEWDFGACCASGMAAALLPTPLSAYQRAWRPSQTRTLLPVHLLLPRANGPPPLPPPIG